jgi:hypothetical protein
VRLSCRQRVRALLISCVVGLCASALAQAASANPCKAIADEGPIFTVAEPSVIEGGAARFEVERMRGGARIVRIVRQVLPPV